ncbi:hypothetical protein NDI45_20440 [Leptolyngbya sp. GB1-A1]|uniref:hypothetical protein n=1 Tax=Leptolyngbya sp. GB1-A1 TaxID=2933908 RepID=UPI003299696B
MIGLVVVAIASAVILASLAVWASPKSGANAQLNLSRQTQFFNPLHTPHHHEF